MTATIISLTSDAFLPMALYAKPPIARESQNGEIRNATGFLAEDV
ncbi:MAG: hypothetical protein AVDCRST_MAG64-354 [uncultured Phycisphaerae bacterium]|uniref:Uncharacterized protein n=1 Tax=uncultured Phycisphaerae bacterium TaxID=904963 RepID=A0A6J4N5C0_9BACT|nr:MAG: hypothetical protein AVDCRST_MAG64-354 [uncultured Phycisphaerae bacterium]